jgi:hypothetical protein
VSEALSPSEYRRRLERARHWHQKQAAQLDAQVRRHDAESERLHREIRDLDDGGPAPWTPGVA